MNLFKDNEMKEKVKALELSIKRLEERLQETGSALMAERRAHEKTKKELRKVADELRDQAAADMLLNALKATGIIQSEKAEDPAQYRVEDERYRQLMRQADRARSASIGQSGLFGSSWPIGGLY